MMLKYVEYLGCIMRWFCSIAWLFGCPQFSFIIPRPFPSRKFWSIPYFLDEPDCTNVVSTSSSCMWIQFAGLLTAYFYMFLHHFPCFWTLLSPKFPKFPSTAGALPSAAAAPRWSCGNNAGINAIYTWSDRTYLVLFVCMCLYIYILYMYCICIVYIYIYVRVCVLIDYFISMWNAQYITYIYIYHYYYYYYCCFIIWYTSSDVEWCG